MSTIESGPTVSDLAISSVQVGDKVAARKDDGDYVVGSIDVQQGRMQVADTAGHIHSYHQDDIVHVTRAA